MPNHPLLTKLNDIDRQMLEAFHKAAKYSDEHFHAAPDARSWSLQQVMYHIWITTDATLTVFKKQAPKAGTLQKATLEASLRSVFLKMMLWLPLKFKAPKIVGQIPNDVSFDDLKAKWDITIAGMSELLTEFPLEARDKLVFKHPAAGWFSLDQTLEFLYDHHSHHQKQLDGLYSWLDLKK